MVCGAPDYAAWVLGSMGSGVVAIDARGAIALVNDGARRILGIRDIAAAEVLGRDCRDVLRAQPTLSRLLLDALAGRTALSRAELVLEAAPGDADATIGFTLCPLRDPTGALAGAAMIFRDLTAFERGEEQQRLQERLTALGQMAAGLAHEIRNPLAGMEVLVGLLRRRLGDEEDALLSDLASELRRVAGTVSASLEFVRPLSPDWERVDPAPLFETALSRARPRVRPDVAITRRYAEGVPSLEADPELLTTALVDLIANACDAMAAGDGRRSPRLELGVEIRQVPRPARAVRVESRRSAQAPESSPVPVIAFSVSDTGPGVPEALRERIFYPFFSTKQGGCGIGLANVQKIAVCHGGSVRIEGEQGGGATFVLELPVRRERPRRERA